MHARRGGLGQGERRGELFWQLWQHEPSRRRMALPREPGGDHQGLGSLREIAQLAKWDAENRAPVSTISDLADHIDHIRDVAGIDHIGIGGDYDGMPTGPIGMEDVTGYPALFVELAKRGYSQEDLEKIASRNMLRVMRGAEAYAASVTDMAPIEYPAGEPRDAGD